MQNRRPLFCNLVVPRPQEALSETAAGFPTLTGPRDPTRASALLSYKDVKTQASFQMGKQKLLAV